MPSMYRKIQNRIHHAIDELHKATAAARALGWIQKMRAPDCLSTKLSAPACSSEQAQAINDHIELLDEEIVSAKLSMIWTAANYILEKPDSDLLTQAPQVRGVRLDGFLLVGEYRIHIYRWLYGEVVRAQELDTEKGYCT